MDPMQPDQPVSSQDEPPMMEPQGPHPEAGESPVDAAEVDARDHLGLELTMSARRMATASIVCADNNDAKSARDFADAALAFTQALVGLYPVQQVDEGETPMQAPRVG